MSTDKTTNTPIIHDIIDILDFAFRLGIAALVVDPEVVRVGDVRHGIGERTEALRINAFADDAVLKRDVVAALREAEAIPASPFNTAMVENHVAAAGKIHGTFSLVAGNAFAETQVAHDDIFLSAERNGASVKRDTLARRRIAEDGNVAADGDVGFETNDATDIKSNCAMRLAHGVAKRICARIIERGNVKRFSAIAAGGKPAKTFRARKGKIGLRRCKLNDAQNGDGNEAW